MKTPPSHAAADDQHESRRRPYGLIGKDQDALAIARRLTSAGHRVLHYILPPHRSTESGPFLEAASTPADIAIDCSIVAFALDDTETMHEILFGKPDHPGMAIDMRPGTVLIDFGIRPPRESHAMLGILGRRAISVVDAALIGGADAVARGTASVLAGGFPDAVDAAMPLLAELGLVEVTGPLGRAQTAAALMGYVEAAHVAARTEALHMGKALGLGGPALARLLDEAPAEKNIVRLARSAALVRRLAAEKGLGADIIDLEKMRGPTSESG